MNDELLLNNYLLVLKSTVEVYVHGTLESSNQDIRELLRSGLGDTIMHQSKTYDIMVEHGYYIVDNIDSNNILKVYNKVSEKNYNKKLNKYSKYKFSSLQIKGGHKLTTKNIDKYVK